MTVSFCAVFFPRDVSDEILNLIESVSEGFPTYSYIHWFVGCFGVNDPLRQYFSLYRVVSQREGERGEKRIEDSKNV